MAAAAAAAAADAVAAVRAAAGGDVTALAALASKVLGYGVVAGAAVLKLPQIVAVVRAGSARGLSAAMFEAEIVGHTVVLASNLQNKMAFNAYGEVVFMLAQNAVLLALIYRSAPPKAARTAALWGAYFAAVAAHVGGAVPPSAVEAAYSVSNLVFWYARVPQILANASAKNTGALSGLSTAMQAAGGAVRILTTIQEGGGRNMLLGYVVGLVLNLILLGQILVYGSGGADAAGSARGRGRGPVTAGPRRRSKQA